eukprot:4635744-Prymnesium_polylepis.1
MPGLIDAAFAHGVDTNRQGEAYTFDAMHCAHRRHAPAHARQTRPENRARAHHPRERRECAHAT